MLSFVDFKTPLLFYDKFMCSILYSIEKCISEKLVELGKYTFHYDAYFLFINQIFVKMLHTLKLFYCI